MNIPEDGDQEVTFLLRGIEGLVRELTFDTRMKGELHLNFREYRNSNGDRVFYHPNGTLTFQELARRAGLDVVPIGIKLFSDGTHGQSNVQYHPMYSKSVNSLYFIVVHGSS